MPAGPFNTRADCLVCHDSGVTRQPDGTLARCTACRRPPRSHRVKRELREQAKLESRMADVKKGKW